MAELIETQSLQSTKPPPQSSLPLITIRPYAGWANLGLRELWSYRHLLFYFTWRDILVRYKQTVLGATWAIIQPLFTMVVFSLFFGGLAKIPSDGIPYPIFSYTALLPWTFFANGLTNASSSLVGSANLLKKVYFPRLTIPISSVVGGLPDFALAFLVLVAMMLYYGPHPTLTSLLWLPVFLLLAVITALGVGLWLAALNVEYRDVRYVVPFMTQMWLFITPIAYPSSLLEEPWRTLYGLNPMAGVIEGFRWALLSGSRDGVSLPPPPVGMMAVSSALAIALMVTGLIYFRRMEKKFADVV